MWERFPVGRPKHIPSKPYSDGGERLKWPTWAYNWDVVSKPPNDLQNAYLRYTNEFDNLLPEQVVWEVYGPRDNFGCEEFRLNPQCDAERNLWYRECPMICMWVVEHYMPLRVMRQFGLYQATPPDYQDTDEALHRLDRLKSKKTDWGKIHQKHVARFILCVREAKKSKRMATKPHCEDAFSEYLHWFLENTRVKLLPDAYPEDIVEEPLPAWDELRNLEYNQDVREGRQTSFAPVMNFVRTEVQKQADELEGALEFPRDEEGNNKLRDFVRKQAQKLRRFANLLGCRDPEVVATSSKEPAKSTSREESSPNDEQSSTAEDEEVLDDMSLEKYQRKVWSAIKLRPRNHPIVESDPEDEPRQKKIAPRRGGKSKCDRK